MTFAEARKAVVAIVGGGLTVAAGIYTTGTLGHVLAIALATVTAAGVYFTPNARPLPRVAQHIRIAPDMDVTAAAKMAARAARRDGGRLM